MIGTAPSFIRLREQIAHFAPTGATVLLTGETGTGKELCARAIHTLSPRQHGPFVPVDCGAVPEHLAESELFGHIRGAFTDAHRNHKGLASLAEGGTLFLDEIDALSLTTQSKLLRFIQESTYRPLGGECFIRANVRVIAASNCDLERMVAAKQFRSDLYFRLNVLRLVLPPLRERRSDVPLLAQHFLEQLTQRECWSVNLLHPASLQKLESYDWPGNVRELLNVLQRASVLAAGAPILPKHILFTTTPSSDDESCATSFRAARSQAIETFERRYIGEMLQKHHGNITHAAREAGHDRRGFGRLAKKYHLDV
jgi:two-component system response regulator GlrR